jgi:hypothetical protein
MNFADRYFTGERAVATKEQSIIGTRAIAAFRLSAVCFSLQL